MSGRWFGMSPAPLEEFSVHEVHFLTNRNAGQPARAGSSLSEASSLGIFGPPGLPLSAEDFKLMDQVEEPLLSDATLPLGASKSWSIRRPATAAQSP